MAPLSTKLTIDDDIDSDGLTFEADTHNSW